MSQASESRPTARFEAQHAELSALAKDVLRTLDTRILSVDPGPARRALATFSGRLRVHATMEQEALYPRLLASPDAAVAAKARELLDEVGDLYSRFFALLKRWPDKESVAADPEGYARDVMMMLHRLHLRMKRENSELYPLADRARGAA